MKRLLRHNTIYTLYVIHKQWNKYSFNKVGKSFPFNKIRGNHYINFALRKIIL